jgi:hypothetical protein
MVALCALGGVVPALKAYRTPVAETLAPVSEQRLGRLSVRAAVLLWCLLAGDSRLGPFAYAGHRAA